MKYYSYDYHGVLTGEGDAEKSQREKDIFLIPAYATFIKPPKFDVKNEIAIFDNGEWVVKLIPKPVIKLKPEPISAEHVLTYKEKRAFEYPDFHDYLDGYVKSHSENQSVHEDGVLQLKKYVDDCLAVKAKYPKNS